MSEDIQQNQEREFSIEQAIEKIRISDKLSLTVLPVEHDPRLLPSIEGSILNLVKNSDGVILEYIPAEVELLQDNPFYSMLSAGIMPFFGKIQEFCISENKDIYSVDPAHDVNFELVAKAPAWIGIAGAGVALLETRKQLADILKHQRPSRRSFLKRLGLAAFALGGGFGAIDGLSRAGAIPDSISAENQFRRIIITEGIKQLGKRIDQESEKDVNLLLVYPPAHWKAIKQKLNDPNNGNLFTKIHSILGQQFEKSFFTIRKYSPSPNGLVKQEIPLR
jgi:hypothetical protein